MKARSLVIRSSREGKPAAADVWAVTGDQPARMVGRRQSAAGNRRVNVVPSPATDRTATSPPIRSTSGGLSHEWSARHRDGVRRIRSLGSPTCCSSKPCAATSPAIAEAVGYDSTFAFARAFKRQVGVSPAVYRRKQ